MPGAGRWGTLPCCARCPSLPRLSYVQPISAVPSPQFAVHCQCAARQLSITTAKRSEQCCAGALPAVTALSLCGMSLLHAITSLEVLRAPCRLNCRTLLGSTLPSPCWLYDTLPLPTITVLTVGRITLATLHRLCGALPLPSLVCSAPDAATRNLTRADRLVTVQNQCVTTMTHYA